MVTAMFVDHWPNDLKIFLNELNISQTNHSNIWIKVQKSIKVDLNHMWRSGKSKLIPETQSAGKKIAEALSCCVTARGGHHKQQNTCRLNKGLIDPVGYKYHNSRQSSVECEFFGSSLLEKRSVRRFNEHQRCYKSTSSSPLGVRSLHDQGRSGDEWRHLLQLLLAAVEFGHQGSADRPHVFSCGFVEGASLQYMLRGLLFSTTGATWRGCQLQFTVHMTVQSVITGAKPHQNDLLLPGQQVVVIPL